MKINYKDLFWMGLGLLFILLIIYRRLILQRLPQDINFEYNLLKIIFISWLVFIYSLKAGLFNYITILILLKRQNSSSTNNFYEKIKDYIIKPFNTLYKNITLWEYTHLYIFKFCHQNYRFFTFLKNKIGFLESYEIPYIIFNLMPRTIVVLALSYDIYNQYFNYFYKTLGLLLIPLIYQTLIKIGQKFFMDTVPLLRNKFNFFDFEILSFNFIKKCLYDNNVPFEYHTWIEEKIKNNTSFYEYGYTIYKFLLFQELYLTQLKEQGWIYLIDKLINYTFAMLWWYILFHMLLNMPPLTFNFLHLLFDYSLKTLTF